jgi:parvulin-like peptidyl-prolyl isomerase
MSKKKIAFFIFSLLTSICNAQPNDILVQMGDLTITEQMLIDEINSNPEERKENLLSQPNQLNEYIDIFYREKIFEQLALQQKADQTPEFKALLKAAKRRLLVNQFVEDKKKNIVVPNLSKSAKEFYRVNKSQFKIGEQVEARHILLKVAKDGKNKDAVRQQLTEILDKIKKDPTQFEALAKKHSEDPGSGAKGGKLGKFSKGRMVKEFDREAFSLSEPGQLSEVFSTKFGFHIIQLIKKHPASTGSFDQAKKQILAKLRKDYIEDEYMRWRNDIVNPDKAQINEEKLQQFVQQLLKKQPTD